ncbi:cadmium-translocating P-type ATPase [Facklamia sp. DSM 111018]|uniref:Cd(2+)-exporting ATPase n=1 Tax=Facklamia lactis TaxID=2749967 RepID=A0ABS0LN20_9LACT|nr:heavy metal translocating P-type ATPase [Facklamia lactis]MBG9985556.1 cadmium-translocating P-type ATPase [Facklamia lactis]
MKFKYRLNGLGCANCAKKIEQKVSQLSEVQNVHLNFSQALLTFESPNKEIEPNQIQAIVDSIENGVQVQNLEQHHPQPTQTKKNHLSLRIIMCLLLFILGFLFTFENRFSLLYYLVIYIIISYEILGKTILQIKEGQWFDEHFLMTIATLGAFAIGEYAEAVAVMLFYQIGEWFQQKAVNQSRQSIADLMDIHPEHAWIRSEQEWVKMDPQDVKIGASILVKAGEKVPLDGKVIEGDTTIDSSALTGESLPVTIETGDPIHSGVINLTRPIIIEVQQRYEDSTVSKIIELVESASAQKATTEKFITRFAKYYTPVVVILALILALFPPLLFQDASWSDWLYRALQFLVISCPCALVISVPLSFYSGIGAAASQGILVKGGNYLEELNKISSIIYDKTGTLTQGKFSIDKIDTYNMTEETALEILAHLEQHSNHPIALSIVDAYGKQPSTSRLTNLEEISGKGIKGQVDGIEYYAGNRQLIEELNIPLTFPASQTTIVYLANQTDLLATVHISDQLKPDTGLAIQELKKLGIMEHILLSGDRQERVDDIAQQLDISQAIGQLLPHEKVHRFENILQQGERTHKRFAFVGDGINDAPVLARADIGIAMGALGSDAAIESADIVIMNDSLNKLPHAIRIARKTLHIAKQNIYLALGIKLFFLILATFGLSNMWEAIIADVGVTILAVLNSLRALKA